MSNMSPELYEKLFGKKPPQTADTVSLADVGVTPDTNGEVPKEFSSNGKVVTTKALLPHPVPSFSDLVPAESQDFHGYTKKFIRQGWQTDDIDHLLNYTRTRKFIGVDETNTIEEVTERNAGTANWSEMGCYKTSTGLWYCDEKIAEKQNPAILIITSKGGKGTFLEAVPEILPNFTLINIETQSMSMYKNGHMLKLPQTHKFVPAEFAFPVVCLAHYDIFSRSNFGQFEVDENDLPLKGPDGKFIFKPLTQCDYITQRKWDMIWPDEFHRLKDRKARWTVQIKKIKATVGKHGSSGTGFINRPDEIWSLLNFLDPVTYPSYWEFKEEFCEVEDPTHKGSKVVGCKPEKLEEFREIVRTIGVRRTLTEVMPHIKEPIFMPMQIELNDTQRKMYNQIKMELRALDQAGVELYAANVLSLLQRLRQICVATPQVISDTYDPILDRRVQKIKLVEPSSKIDAVMEILEGLQWDDEAKEPLVVFSCFKDPLELLKARLDNHNKAVVEMQLPESELYQYLHLDVGDSDLERYRKWHDEFPTLKYRIFMSTLQLGGESINLTPSRHVVFLDRSWSPKDNSQGIGRIRRPGQEGQPVVIHINAADTTDQYVERVNDVKHGWFKQIFGNEAI